MDPFPLLTLPETELYKLLNEFHASALFQLSQCSRKALNVVKTFASSFQEARFVIYLITKVNPQIYLHSPNYRSVTMFTFYGDRDPNRLDLRFPKTYNFEGQLIDFCKEGTRRSRYGCATPHSTADVIKFLSYLMNVFNAELSLVGLDGDDDSLTGPMTNWLLKNRSMTIGINEGRVTHEEMSWVLECCEGTMSLQLHCTPGQHFSYDKTISADHLDVHNGTWIKRHNLVKFNCEYVNIGGSHLKNEDLNAFVSHWLQSGDEKLKFMRIYGKWNTSEEEENKFVQEEVLKGLPTLPGVQKRQDAISAFRTVHINLPFEAGMDLRRESDGKLATVVVQKGFIYGVAFTFVVWQEPHPNVVVVVP